MPPDWWIQWVVQFTLEVRVDGEIDKRRRESIPARDAGVESIPETNDGRVGGRAMDETNPKCFHTIEV